MNVGELVDALMGMRDGQVDFEKEVIPADAPVMFTLSDGTMVSVTSVEYEPNPEIVFDGTLQLRGDYR